MPRRRKGEPPRLIHHRATNQAYVTIQGRRIYLGTFGTEECRRRYRALLQEWEHEQGIVRAERGRTLYLNRGATIAELVKAYLKDAATKYTVDGQETSTMARCRLWLGRGLVGQYGDWTADEWRHPEFEEFRRYYLARGYARSSIRDLNARVLVLFRWAHKRGIVSAETLLSLASSPETGEGEEREPIEPVPREHFERLLAFLAAKKLPPGSSRAAKLAAMLQLQDLVGMRPGELCRMRADEIRQDGTIKIKSKTIQVIGTDGQSYAGWIFQPSRHKTMRKGRVLAYLVGPKAREILAQWLPADGCVWPGIKPGKPLVYNGYARAVQTACRQCGIPPFAPNRIRHSVATRYSLAAGLDAANQVLSHASLDMTAIYAKRGLEAVTGLVEKFG